MKKKESIITFKVSEELRELIGNIPNRSEFIRAAIMTALENVCPLCNGTGLLSPKQKEHWEGFAQSHAIRRCDDCHELVIECANSGDRPEQVAAGKNHGQRTPQTQGRRTASF